MKKLLIVIFLFSVLWSYGAEKEWQKNGIKVPPPVCYASGKVEKSFVPPPPEFLNQLKSGVEQKSDIVVSYSLFPENAKNAFEYAVGIWETILESPVPIHLKANWRTKDKNVLGSCGPSSYYTDFENIPKKGRFYPVAVVEKITGEELTGPSAPDMNAEFNKDINWYFGTDGNTPDSLYDFVTVVLHEIGHGLGFTGFFFVDGTLGGYGYQDMGDASAFDVLVVKNNGDRLSDTLLFANPSSDLKKAFESGLLFSNSPVALADGGGYKTRLYAPATFNDGSSLYHLNDDTYPYGSPNALMTHAIGKGEAAHDPGPITKGIMADIGWKPVILDFTPVKDIESVKPVTFSVDVKSEYALDTASMFVVYSNDRFSSHRDSVPLVLSAEINTFTAELLPAISSGSVEYYVNVTDEKKRTVSMPAEAPKEKFAFSIGPDTEAPVIDHQAIPYFLLNGDSLMISASVDDNLGIDTVYIDYSVNGISQPSFGLARGEGTNYSGTFNFSLSQLNDGDIITYNVVARDASVAGNTKRIPFKDKFSFKIEGIFDPVGGYTNSFDYPLPDFIESDFSIYTASGFDNGALHSAHPYLSPNQNNTYWNFTTLLKRPVILQENGKMTYDEVVLVEPGEAYAQFGDDDFWDYVIAEGSKNKGKTWLPLAKGYDSNNNTSWKDTYNREIIGQVSTAAGKKELFVNRTVDLLGTGNFAAGDTILIRFRLFSDPYAHGWGWAIDNLRIQQPVSAPELTLSPGNITIYPNPFKDKLTVSLDMKSTVEEIQMEVFNLYGQKVKETTQNQVFGILKQELDLTGQPAGMYLVSVRENGVQVLSKKVVKF